MAYGDTRFHDPKDTKRRILRCAWRWCRPLPKSNPAFICFTGDIVYNGYDSNDWKVWDSETSIWRDKKIPVYPALGNHDLHGDEKIALGNYFQRFPDLKNSRYYSVRAANTLMLVLDSSLDEADGPQGQWLADKLDHVPSDVDFVFRHVPPSALHQFVGREDAWRRTLGARAQNRHWPRCWRSAKPMLASASSCSPDTSTTTSATSTAASLTLFPAAARAHAYPIERAPDDPFQSKEINYHYLLVEVDHQQLKITMNRIDLTSGKPVWTQPDSVKITVPAATATAGK